MWYHWQPTPAMKEKHHFLPGKKSPFSLHQQTPSQWNVSAGPPVLLREYFSSEVLNHIPAVEGKLLIQWFRTAQQLKTVAYCPKVPIRSGNLNWKMNKSCRPFSGKTAYCFLFAGK